MTTIYSDCGLESYEEAGGINLWVVVTAKLLK